MHAPIELAGASYALKFAPQRVGLLGVELQKG
jgi:hypothetical protein